MKYFISIIILFTFSSCKQPDATTELQKIEALCNENSWDAAAYELKKILKLGENYPRVYALYAYIQNRRGLPGEVEKFILKANPTNSKPDSQILTMIGRIYIEQGEYAQAIKTLDQAYRLDLENSIPLKLLMLAEISSCKQANGEFDLKKYIKNAKGLKYLMGRKKLRDEVFYNHVAIKEIIKDGNKNFIMPFLKKAQNLEPSNSSSVLNEAIALDIIYNSPKLARIKYAKFIDITKGTRDPQIPEVERRLRQLQGLE